MATPEMSKNPEPEAEQSTDKLPQQLESSKYLLEHMLGSRWEKTRPSPQSMFMSLTPEQLAEEKKEDAKRAAAGERKDRWRKKLESIADNTASSKETPNE